MTAQTVPGSKAKTWGIWLIVLGVLAIIIGTSVQGGADTGQGLLTGGLIIGFGGWGVIIGIVLLIVSAARRRRSRTS